MNKTRLEAFSDGVLAIIITIMVLELKVPLAADFAALQPLAPVLISYVLSFIFIGIYWNNHHHLLQLVEKVDGRVLWANAHLLFWLSLIPFATAWMGEHHFAQAPVALYGMLLFCAACAFFILAKSLLALHGAQSCLAAALGTGRKEKLSLLIYAVAIPVAFIQSIGALVLYAVVAAIWLVPDRRIEKII